MQQPPNPRRALIVAIVLSIVATLLTVLVLAPGLSPGNGSDEASGQVVDNTVLIGIVTPIAVLLLSYFAYALFSFRQRGDEPEEGVATPADRRVQTTWLATTSRDRPLPGGLWHRAALRRRLRRWPGRRPDREAVRPAAAGPGDRAAVGVHIPLTRPSEESRPRTSSCPSTVTSSSTSRRST